MTSNDIRQKFLDFFKSKGHKIIPSASLIPEHDPTVLFTTAGMHPLVPYLLGETHPEGKRLANFQKCIRTQDIDEVGDNTHLTFFEMLGNWSLGDYFKKEAIEWSFEFLTDSDTGLGLDPKKIYVTVFAGDTDAPKDKESIGLWKEQFRKAGIDAKENERIFAYPKNKNWWGPAGQTGPCGPDTEMFYDTGAAHQPEFGEKCHPNCECGKYVEIWNDVFMEYNKTREGKYEPLAQKNVDTGMGLERVVAIMQGVNSVYETDLFSPIVDRIKKLAVKPDIRSLRIIADHLKAAVFILGDEQGVAPSNLDQGYVLRRLIRLAVRHGRKLGIAGNFISSVAGVVIEHFKDAYPELLKNRDKIISELNKEEIKFRQTLEKGMKEFERILETVSDHIISGKQAFILFSTYGFPWEMTKELAAEKGIKVDAAGFQDEFKKHQELSRAGAEQKFKGGLADHSEKTTRLHTAAHLLHQALRLVLGEHVFQKGSNITEDRLRFDFSHPEKMTTEQIKQVEEIVNEQIKADLPVKMEEMTVEQAKQSGAIGVFEHKYGEKVKVYSIGNFSKEICGGPHVSDAGELGNFKIAKEQSSSAGVRRIKATLET